MVIILIYTSILNYLQQKDVYDVQRWAVKYSSPIQVPRTVIIKKLKQINNKITKKNPKKPYKFPLKTVLVISSFINTTEFLKAALIVCVWWSLHKSLVINHWVIDPELVFFVILLIWTIKSSNNLKKNLFCLDFFGANSLYLKEWELDLLCFPKIMHSDRKYQSIEISNLNPMSRFKKKNTP